MDPDDNRLRGMDLVKRGPNDSKIENEYADFENPGEISPTLPGSFASVGQYGHSEG